MELQHVNIKIPVEGELGVDLDRFIGVFHGWVSEQKFDDLLIDVADYRHVPHGPGVMLIGFEADRSIDNAGGRWGLLFNRKASLEGSNADRLGQALGSAAGACELLEAEFAGEGLNFSRTEFDLLINDRALAPNTAETLAAATPEIEAFLYSVLGDGGFSISHNDNPRLRFGVTVKTQAPFDLAALAGATA